MKKTSLSVVLAFVLVLSLGGTSLAAPLDNGNGTFVLFGQCGPNLFYDPITAFTVGAGYAFSDVFALGIESQVYSGTASFGAFANIDLDPIIIKGEVIAPGGLYYSKLTGLYAVDLDPLTVGLGGGAVFIPGASVFFVEADASIATGDFFSLYCSVHQFVNLISIWPEITMGIAATF